MGIRGSGVWQSPRKHCLAVMADRFAGLPYLLGSPGRLRDWIGCWAVAEDGDIPAVNKGWIKCHPGPSSNTFYSLGFIAWPL